MRRLLLFSTSTVHGGGYLDYGLPYLRDFLGATESVLFVPYARPSGISHERYTRTFREALEPAGYAVTGLNESDEPAEAVRQADSLFVGGGNTFVLLRELYERELIEPVRERVAGGMPYMGSSAGSNVAGRTIGTTNDMPIVYPPSFEAFDLVPFNINPHYLDPAPDSTHMGETRETRIREFHRFNPWPVIGLREGALLRAEDDELRLLGERGARLFRAGAEPKEISPDARLDELLVQ